MSKAKSGIATTEYLGGVAPFGAALIFAQEDPSEWVRLSAMVMFGLVVCTYIIMRTRAKNGAPKA